VWTSVGFEQRFYKLSPGEFANFILAKGGSTLIHAPEGATIDNAESAWTAYGPKPDGSAIG
jgi:hypothetical protein